MLSDFLIFFTDRYASKYATKPSLHYLVKHQHRKTSENLKHASLSMINHKVV